MINKKKLIEFYTANGEGRCGLCGLPLTTLLFRRNVQSRQNESEEIEMVWEAYDRRLY